MKYDRVHWDGCLPVRRYAIFNNIIRDNYVVVVRGDDIARTERLGGFVSWLGAIKPEETRAVIKNLL